MAYEDTQKLMTRPFAIVREFIGRIIIQEPDIPRGDRVQKVEIIYNNVGAVDHPTLKESRA